MCLCARAHVQLFANPWNAVHHAPLSIEFSRQEYWSGFPFPTPGDIPDPDIQPESTASPALVSRFFITDATWESHIYLKFHLNPISQAASSSRDYSWHQEKTFWLLARAFWGTTNYSWLNSFGCIWHKQYFIPHNQWKRSLIWDTMPDELKNKNVPGWEEPPDTGMQMPQNILCVTQLCSSSARFSSD